MADIWFDYVFFCENEICFVCENNKIHTLFELDIVPKRNFLLEKERKLITRRRKEI